MIDLEASYRVDGGGQEVHDKLTGSMFFYLERGLSIPEFVTVYDDQKAKNVVSK